MRHRDQARPDRATEQAGHCGQRHEDGPGPDLVLALVLEAENDPGSGGWRSFLVSGPAADGDAIKTASI